VRGLDFSSWQGLLSTAIGLALITLIGVGLRLMVMQIIQQRRERDNRQVNERLKTLIAAYKTLGGSFTGKLSVDPAHLSDYRKGGQEPPSSNGRTRSDRSRRIRDAVESALSDIILLGTEDQVRLAAQAAQELAAGNPVHTANLVVSLRDFIREVLDLEAVPRDLIIPKQGPARALPSKAGKEDASREGGKQGGGGMHDGAGGGSGIDGRYTGEDSTASHHEP
jgi:hypothetical protein